MYLAYIDEIGETGAFVCRSDPQYNTSPAFGYAGFLIPSHNARRFGAEFQAQKKKLFASSTSHDANSGRWEIKGSDVFRKKTPEQAPSNLRVFDHLTKICRDFGGNLFYYAAEKNIGTPRQTSLDKDIREMDAMRETLNRLASHSGHRDSDIMVLIDQINEKERKRRLPKMYSHILGRSTQHREMRRLIEPPMHLDSQLSANIQFADWVAACVTRAIDYQLLVDSPFGWVADSSKLKQMNGTFTHDSKLHLYGRSVDDINHSKIFHRERPLYPKVDGHTISSQTDPKTLRRLRAMAGSSANRK
ncbi:DUF3800 domain-containing protein [Kocuria soli]|uniref:DUF3800 domain-containing protein n=1 Tax=Kocuria soli TaxID=2485125 RepID=A0A3N4A2V3_9MICC|nr:DUF3800 domain-containing protein [Kocuria soli]ROZ62771.1 DUF3800 domain-containing protein [Kocuria soli]